MTDARSTQKTITHAVPWPQLTVAFAAGALFHVAVAPVLRWLVRVRPSFSRMPGCTKATNNAVVNAGGQPRKVLCLPKDADALRKLLSSELWEVASYSSPEDCAKHPDAIAIIIPKYRIVCVDWVGSWLIRIDK